jgi:DedD protein
MDQGLKERLVGAAVLVAIAVWLIPWVLDGTGTSVEPTASSLQLPAAEEPMPMRTQTLRLGDEEASSEPAPTAAPVAQVAAAPESAGAQAQAQADTDTATDHEAPAAETTVAAVVPEAERPRPTPPAESRAAPSPPKPSTAAPAASGDWTVQLGVFSDEANARRLAQRAGTFGHKAEVSSYRNQGKTMYRVRVGPQATRAAADATASALRAHGVEARVMSAR